MKLFPIKLPFFKRYVDEIITCVPENKINTLPIFNSYHEKIQFTAEIEEDNRISFLNLLIRRSDNNIIETDCYQKPSNSIRNLNFNVEHLLQHKINIIKNLKERAFELSHTDFQYEMKTIWNMMKNNYPNKLIEAISFRENNSKKRKTRQKRTKKVKEIMMWDISIFLKLNGYQKILERS